MKLIIDTAGNITAVAHMAQDREALQAMGIEVVSYERGGYVLPAVWWKRWLFRGIRACLPFAPVTQWTRTWSGAWLVQIDGSWCGLYGTRQEAIEAEETAVFQRLQKEVDQ